MKKKIIPTSLLIILLASLAISSCQKDMGPPSVSFVEAEGFLSEDTMLMVGDTVTVGLKIEWNGTDELKTLEVYASELLLQTYILTHPESGEYSFKLIKSGSDEEKWKFTVIDKKGNQATISIILVKDPNSIYGPVVTYNIVRLGAQKNTNTPGFVSLSEMMSFTLDEAFANQELIDILYYYEDSVKACIASPGANINSNVFSGSSAIENWSVRNTTRFVKIDMTAEEYESIFHDGFLITRYSEEDAKRKATDLKMGDVYVFKIESGRLGVFLVKNIEGEHYGAVELGIKLQGE